jgi:hypothetical protein
MYLTPLALAIWILDEARPTPGRGIKISTNSFSKVEVEFLATVLRNKYGLETSVQSAGAPN